METHNFGFPNSEFEFVIRVKPSQVLNFESIAALEKCMRPEKLFHACYNWFVRICIKNTARKQRRKARAYWKGSWIPRKHGKILILRWLQKYWMVITLWSRLGQPPGPVRPPALLVQPVKKKKKKTCALYGLWYSTSSSENKNGMIENKKKMWRTFQEFVLLAIT